MPFICEWFSVYQFSRETVICTEQSNYFKLQTRLMMTALCFQMHKCYWLNYITHKHTWVQSPKKEPSFGLSKITCEKKEFLTFTPVKISPFVIPDKSFSPKTAMGQTIHILNMKNTYLNCSNSQMYFIHFIHFAKHYILSTHRSLVTHNSFSCRHNIISIGIEPNMTESLDIWVRYYISVSWPIPSSLEWCVHFWKWRLSPFPFSVLNILSPSAFSTVYCCFGFRPKDEPVILRRSNAVFINLIL